MQYNFFNNLLETIVFLYKKQFDHTNLFNAYARINSSLKSLSSFRKPKMNKKVINVVFSRKIEQLTDAANLLCKKTFNIIACPLIYTGPVKETAPLINHINQSVTANYIVFTSQYAITELFKYYKKLGISKEQLSNINMCSVGPGTAGKLAEYGVDTKIMPSIYNADTFSELFPEIKENSSVIFFPKGNLADKKLGKALTEKGYKVISPVLYITKFNTVLTRETEDLFNQNNVDCFVFTSPSTVKAFMATANAQHNISVLKKRAIICAIGTTTKQACLNAGLNVTIIPKDFTIEGIAKAIKHYFDIKNNYSISTKENTQ